MCSQKEHSVWRSFLPPANLGSLGRQCRKSYVHMHLRQRSWTKIKSQLSLSFNIRNFWLRDAVWSIANTTLGIASYMCLPCTKPNWLGLITLARINLILFGRADLARTPWTWRNLLFLIKMNSQWSEQNSNFFYPKKQHHRLSPKQVGVA